VTCKAWPEKVWLFFVLTCGLVKASAPPAVSQGSTGMSTPATTPPVEPL
jgi:hypothetical protein